MSYWTRGSQSELHGRNTWGALKNPVVHAAPRLIKLEFLGFGPRYQDFLTLPSWFQHAAKFENQWMEQRSTSALSHSQWPQKILQKARCLRLHHLVCLSCFLNQFWDDNSRKQYRGHWRYFVTSFTQQSHWLIRIDGIPNVESFHSHNRLHLKFIISALFMKYLSKHSTELTFNTQIESAIERACMWTHRAGLHTEMEKIPIYTYMAIFPWARKIS